jgi:hypothetical protein
MICEHKSAQRRQQMSDAKAPDSKTEPAFALPDGRQSQAAADITRGTMRMLSTLAFAPVQELTLANHRRADIAAIGPKGEIWIIEVKSCLNDFRTDGKWPDYSDYCDRFFFAVDADFPADVIPDDTGLVIADRYGAEIVRDSPENQLSGGRRKALTLRFARAATQRLHGLVDPRPQSRFE